MFQRFSKGYSLAKQSWAVLKAEKQLIVFPILSGVCCLMVMASFAIPLFVTGGGAEALANVEQDAKAGGDDSMQECVVSRCALFVLLRELLRYCIF